MSLPSDRRQFIGLSLAGLGHLTLGAPGASALDASAQPSAGEPLPPVTQRLAEYVVSGNYADLPAAVRKEAQRTLLNWMGCAVGGSRHETLDVAHGRPRRPSADLRRPRCSAAASGWTS